VFEACSDKNLNLAKFLINFGYWDIHEKDCANWNPFMIACGYGHLELARILVQRDCEINDKNSDGWTAFLSAVEWGNLDLVKYLVQIGCNVYEKNNDGQNALLIACAENEFEIVKYFCEENFEFDIHSRDDKRYNGFLYACRAGNFDMVQYFINKGCDIHAKSIFRENAVSISCKSNHFDLMKFLLEKVGCQLDEKKVFFRTCFVHVCRLGDLNVTRYLVQKGCDIHKRDSDENTGFMLACEEGHSLEFIEYLLEIGCSIDAKNFEGQNGITLAFQNDQFEVVIFLLQQTRMALYPYVWAREETEQKLQNLENLITAKKQEIESKIEILDQCLQNMDYFLISLISKFSFGLENLEQAIEIIYTNPHE
jgi:ankyrin repeat protein